MAAESSGPLQRFWNGDWAQTRRACAEERESLLNCVLASDCFNARAPGDFRRCVQEDIDANCKPLRYAHEVCCWQMVYWVRSLRD